MSFVPPTAASMPATCEPTGISPDEALLISGHDESDYDDLEESQSDISFPSLSEACQPTSSNIPNIKEPPKEADPGSKHTAQRQSSLDLETSSARVSAPTVAEDLHRPSGVPQVKQGQPSSTDIVSHEEQASEDIACNTAAEEVVNAVSRGGETHRLPSHSRDTTSLPDEGLSPESKECSDVVIDGRNDDGTKPSQTEPATEIRIYVWLWLLIFLQLLFLAMINHRLALLAPNLYKYACTYYLAPRRRVLAR
jgi:hypothetical protein